MKEERYSIIFSSKTGNTAELANVIRDALPQENCDYFGTSEIEEPVSEMLYIGFGQIREMQINPHWNYCKE